MVMDHVRGTDREGGQTGRGDGRQWGWALIAVHRWQWLIHCLLVVVWALICHSCVVVLGPLSPFIGGVWVPLIGGVVPLWLFIGGWCALLMGGVISGRVSGLFFVGGKR